MPSVYQFVNAWISLYDTWYVYHVTWASSQRRTSWTPPISLCVRLSLLGNVSVEIPRIIARQWLGYSAYSSTLMMRGEIFLRKKNWWNFNGLHGVISWNIYSVFSVRCDLNCRILFSILNFVLSSEWEGRGIVAQTACDVAPSATPLDPWGPKQGGRTGSCNGIAHVCIRHRVQSTAAHVSSMCR
jgi:hypothetical protein